MSLSPPFLLILLLLNGRVQSNTCSTEGFMELSLLETKTGTNNNGQTTGLAFGSERTRWIITEGEKVFSGCRSTLTEVLVGVDIRTVTDDRNRYPKIDIWESQFASDSYRRRSRSFPLILSPHNFTTNGLYRYTLPTPLTIHRYTDYRLGVFQPPDDISVVRFYKVTGTGQIGVFDSANEDSAERDFKDDNDLTLETSRILIHPIMSMSLITI